MVLTIDRNHRFSRIRAFARLFVRLRLRACIDLAANELLPLSAASGWIKIQLFCHFPGFCWRIANCARTVLFLIGNYSRSSQAFDAYEENRVRNPSSWLFRWKRSISAAKEAGMPRPVLELSPSTTEPPSDNGITAVGVDDENGQQKNDTRRRLKGRRVVEAVIDIVESYVSRLHCWYSQDRSQDFDSWCMV